MLRAQNFFGHMSALPCDERVADTLRSWIICLLTCGTVVERKLRCEKYDTDYVDDCG